MRKLSQVFFLIEQFLEINPSYRLIWAAAGEIKIENGENAGRMQTFFHLIVARQVGMEVVARLSEL
ncbi:MAG: hypothetical protein LAO21_13140 [Acidobacteriia bacterium]|nr:hypothetical protein [Terriglobia bacterium]